MDCGGVKPVRLKQIMRNQGILGIKSNHGYRNRPDIRLNPVPAGYLALISGSGSGPVSKKFAEFFPDNSSKKCISKILKCLVFD